MGPWAAKALRHERTSHSDWTRGSLLTCGQSLVAGIALAINVSVNMAWK